MRYEELGFSSLDEYCSYFLKSLLPTNKTYEYFINWDRVQKNAETYKEELHLLNSLRNEREETIKDSFVGLASRYPEVISVLPLLIAERVKKGHITIFDEDLDEFIDFNFNASSYSTVDLNRIAKFCDKTGILKLITSVKDLYDYLLGVEAGVDTNARKNRSGKIFEKIVKKMLIKELKEKNYKVVDQDQNISLYITKKGKRINRHDFVLYKNGEATAIIEVNFYNTAGSKPDSIVGNYISLFKEAKKRNLDFIWITDGPAWRDMRHYLTKAMEEIDWVLNYAIAKNKIKDILKK